MVIDKGGMWKASRAVLYAVARLRFYRSAAGWSGQVAAAENINIHKEVEQRRRKQYWHDQVFLFSLRFKALNISAVLPAGPCFSGWVWRLRAGVTTPWFVDSYTRDGRQNGGKY